ncbi:HAD hydrolase, family IA, variant 1 [delta proteobacterium NaphS2]|nr:HAD hydrolase, family IA, variant 1 [delta proteobacterium NaphS2]
MRHIQAIGFDLFNTLIMADTDTLTKAFSRMQESLGRHGFYLETEVYKKVYYDAAIALIQQARKDGRETHNRFWISAALLKMGYEVSPDDPRIAATVEDYFSAFYDSCHCVPGAKSMLERLKGEFHLGLLSNFTHWPAALEIIDRLELAAFFDFRLISGQLGYRKPHKKVFEALENGFEASRDEIIYVGDDVDADVNGALGAGIQPIWFTYVLENNPPIPEHMAPSEAGEPHESVPRVSSWAEFLSFLEVS